MAVTTVEVNGGSALVNCVPDSVLPTTIDPPGFSSSPKTISVPEVPLYAHQLWLRVPDSLSSATPDSHAIDECKVPASLRYRLSTI